jgi:hypothetical protein
MPPPSATAPADPPAEATEPGDYLHNGFYVRVSTGFAAYDEMILRSEDTKARTTITGMGTAGELAIGGTIGRMVLGGGIWSTSVMASDITTKGGGVSVAAIPTERPTFALLGPFIDSYFDPKRGFHIQIALGLAAMRGYELGGYSLDTDAFSFGGGFMVAFGHEWWVAKQWSVGVLGRVSGALTTEKVAGERYYHVIGSAPAALFTVTYH